MNELMNRMMLSCKKATELVEKKTVLGLSWSENIQLKMHLTMCSVSRKSESQSRIIDFFLEQINSKNPLNKMLPKEVKDKIITEIEKK